MIKIGWLSNWQNKGVQAASQDRSCPPFGIGVPEMQRSKETREISILHFELQMETMEKKRILGKDPENLCVTLQTQKFSHLDSELVFQMALSKRDSILYLTYEMQSVIINVSRGEFSWWSFKFASQLARIDDSCSEVKSKGIFSFSWSLHQEPVNYSPWAKIPSTTCFCK